MDENKQEYTKEYILASAFILCAGIIILGGALFIGSKSISIKPENSQMVQAEFQPPSAQSGEIGVVDFDRVMSEHPLIKEGEAIAQEKFKAVEEEVKNLPEQERAEAWQSKYGEIVGEMQKKYVEPAKKDVNEAIDKVLDQNGIRTCLTNTNVFRGGVDITDDVIARLQK